MPRGQSCGEDALSNIRQRQNFLVCLSDMGGDIVSGDGRLRSALQMGATSLL